MLIRRSRVRMSTRLDWEKEQVQKKKKDGKAPCPSCAAKDQYSRKFRKLGGENDD